MVVFIGNPAKGWVCIHVTGDAGTAPPDILPGTLRICIPETAITIATSIYPVMKRVHLVFIIYFQQAGFSFCQAGVWVSCVKAFPCYWQMLLHG